jgi:hypothetical protein
MTVDLLVSTASSSSSSPGTFSSGTNSSSGTQTPTPKSNHAGTIAAGVLGGVLVLTILAFLAFFFVASKKRKDAHRAELYGNPLGQETKNGDAFYSQHQVPPAELAEGRNVHEVAG